MLCRIVCRSWRWEWTGISETCPTLTRNREMISFSSALVNERLKSILISYSLNMPLHWDFIIIILVGQRVFTESISETWTIKYPLVDCKRTSWEKVVHLPLLVSYCCLIHSFIFQNSISIFFICKDFPTFWVFSLFWRWDYTMDRQQSLLLLCQEGTQSRSKQIIKTYLQMTIFQWSSRSHRYVSGLEEWMVKFHILRRFLDYGTLACPPPFFFQDIVSLDLGLAGLELTTYTRLASSS